MSISTAFLVVLVTTGVVWVLRGLGILTFVPGGIIWLLLLLTISLGVISALRRAQ